MNAADFWSKIFGGAWHKRTSNWGWRTYTYKGKKVTDFHVGVDEAPVGNKPLYPAEYAYVVKVGKDSSSGNFVYIWCAGILHFYCHLSVVYVSVGQTITPGTKIGLAGSTGHSTGIHLHFGIRKPGYKDWINPDGWIASYQPTAVKTRYVNAKIGLNVRSKPDKLSSKLTALPDNTKVSVLMEYNGWSYITTGAIFGWVSSQYLSDTR